MSACHYATTVRKTPALGVERKVKNLALTFGRFACCIPCGMRHVMPTPERDKCQPLSATSEGSPASRRATLFPLEEESYSST